jgi:hypothetical protein
MEMRGGDSAAYMHSGLHTILSGTCSSLLVVVQTVLLYSSCGPFAAASC